MALSGFHTAYIKFQVGDAIHMPSLPAGCVIAIIGFLFDIGSLTMVFFFAPLLLSPPSLPLLLIALLSVSLVGAAIHLPNLSAGRVIAVVGFFFDRDSPTLVLFLFLLFPFLLLRRRLLLIALLSWYCYCYGRRSQFREIP